MVTARWFGIFGVRECQLFFCMGVTGTGAIGAVMLNKLRLRDLKSS